MFSTSLARFLATRNIHYGWMMVALVLLYGICSSATLGIPGVLMVPMAEEFGWSIGDLSAPFGVRMALFGLIAPFAAGLMLVYRLRTVLTVAALLIIAGLVLAMTMTAKWELWLSLGVILGVATGMTSLVLATKIATTWFVARRGLVVGILGAGNATGQLIFLPLAAWLAEHWGWRSALVPSVVMIALLAVAFLLPSRDRPSELGLAPFGADTIVPPPRPTQGQCLRDEHRRIAERLALDRVLGAGIRVLHLRRDQLRADSAFRHAVRRQRHRRSQLDPTARADRRLRFHWHDRVRLALGSLR